MVELIFQPEAEFDLEEAQDWYEERTPGLGAKFLHSVDACARLIRSQPEMFPVIHENVRRGVLRHFPYSLLYVVMDNRAFVLSVFHSSRDPKTWQDRL